MPCDCFFANVFTFFVTLNFILHIYSLASPCWVCNIKPGNDKCEPEGIYNSCAEDGSYVPDMGPFVLAILILISNVSLMIILCIKIRRSFLPAVSILTFVLIGWYVIQETILGGTVFGILWNSYDKIGWALWLFFIPGIVMVFILLLLHGLYICTAKSVCACPCEAGEKAV